MVIKVFFKALFHLVVLTFYTVFALNTESNLDKVLSEEQTTLCALSFSKSIGLIHTREEAPLGCASAVVSDKCTAFVVLKVICLYYMLSL